ncbi:MAG: UMP kinase [Kiritimatiellaeota bacterium]|nr:UMP kinase [Kiritimatiellota bacterium]
MGSSFTFDRILLKISGETLKGNLEFGYESEAVKLVVKRIGALLDSGVEIALVVGAGNVWRGVMGADWGMDNVTADYMGMLGTVMNALCLKDSFNAAGYSAEVQTSIPMEPIAARYERDAAKRALEEGRILIFACGTGSPFFTTDTTATLRALEIGAEVVMKATKVNGVYSADPMIHPDAKRYETITYDEALSAQLGVMDSTAFSMCRDNDLPILVFNFFEPDSLENALNGDYSTATLVSR